MNKKRKNSLLLMTLLIITIAVVSTLNLTGLPAANSSTDPEHEDIWNFIYGLESHVSSLEGAITNVLSDLLVLETEIWSYVFSLESYMLDEFEKLISQVDTLYVRTQTNEGDILSIKNQLFSIQADIESLEDENAALRSDLEALEAENAALRSDLDALNAHVRETSIKFIELPGTRMNIYGQSEYEISADETTHVWHGFRSSEDRTWSDYTEEQKTEFLSTAQWRFTVDGEEVHLDHVLRYDEENDVMWSLFYRVFPPGYFSGSHDLVGQWHYMEDGVWASIVREAKLKVK